MSNYLSQAEKLITHHKVDVKLDKLVQDWNIFFYNERNIIISIVDKQITNFLIRAEKNCRLLRAGAISYSPLLSKASLK